MFNQKTSPNRARRWAREPGSDTSTTPLPVADKPMPSEPKVPTKSSLLLDLLGREEGATLEQLVAATGWQPHTTRAALTGLRKQGHAITRMKEDGVSRYTLAEGGA